MAEYWLRQGWVTSCKSVKLFQTQIFHFKIVVMKWPHISLQSFWLRSSVVWGLSRWLSGEERACQCRECKRCKFHPQSGRSTGIGNGIPLQYSCLENPMDRGVWRVRVHGGVAKSWTWLKRLSTRARGLQHMNFEETQAFSPWHLLWEEVKSVLQNNDIVYIWRYH